jgi:predicted nuclease with TOPRIM domain
MRAEIADVEGSSADEERLKAEIDREKASYKAKFSQLKSLKTEIEHLQHISSKSRQKLQKDFDDWWDETERQRKMNRGFAERKENSNSWKKKPPSTGDELADAEIDAFYRLRERLHLSK